MSAETPNVVVLAGPNGAGKTTASKAVLRDYLDVGEFVNADIIAQGISPFRPQSAAIAAGRIMLERLRELAAARKSFAFETTLASRSFVPWLKEVIATGYRFHLIFFWLDRPETAIERVKRRVSLGGHHVPDDVVRRRYDGGLRNFLQPVSSDRGDVAHLRQL
jgi:predicted ABC-type ATPase